MRPCEGVKESDTEYGPVPHASDELAAAIGLAGPDRGTLLDRENFTAEKLSSSGLSKFGIVVFATHGQPENDTHPARLISQVLRVPSEL